MIGPNPPLPELDRAFRAWLCQHEEAHAHFKREPRAFDDKVKLLCELQRELFDAGWARYGWPEEKGGLGGSVLHRAVVVDAMMHSGYPPRHLFEHLDILPPALERFAQPDLLEKLFLPTLRGDVLWCQGFSEPSAGSDLAALRTRAEKSDGGYRIDGHKIWTSWAHWATHCLLLARTGTTEDRHRGLTAFVVDLETPGVKVGTIRQSNGHDELAEVFFDGALVPHANRVGEEGEGWAVAMHILAGERGSYTWLRQCEMLPRLEWLARVPGAEVHAASLGESLLRLLALRCRSRVVVEMLARGEAPGPESSVTKVLAVDGEQHFYDVAREVMAPGIDFGTCDDVDFWQEHYLYSRASSVYGGSRQIQLNVIAKLLISRGETPTEGDDEALAVQQSVAHAIEQNDDGRAALEGLDWWSFAAAPEDAFGRAAFAACFEEQGKALVTSPALAGVAGAAVARALDVGPWELGLGIDPGHGDGLLACGLDAGTRWLVLDAGADAVLAFPSEGLAHESSGAFDGELLRSVRVARAAGRRVDIDRDAQARATSLARIGASFEILGAGRALLARSISHCGEREQFGQPIARFQAIQHLLSESQIDLSALGELCKSALEQWSVDGAMDLSKVAKAFAGRAGRDVAQRALQCFGAIGFTDEHPHHRYSKRIHTLDMMLGSSYALRRELGVALVRTGSAPRCIQAWRPT